MISLLLTGYVSYDKMFSNNNEVIIVDQDSNVKQNSNNLDNQLNNKIDISDNNDDNEVSDNSGFMLDAYENIITSDLSKLLGENSLSELSNQDILYMLVEMYKNQNEFPEDFTKEDLDNIHRNSVLRNINFVHEDISDYSIVNEYTGSPLFNYSDSTYKYANTGHSYETLKIVNKELVEIIEKDNEVMLSYKFVFLKQSGNNPVYLKLYSTIDDVRNNKLLEEYTYYENNSSSYNNASSDVIDVDFKVVDVEENTQ